MRRITCSVDEAAAAIGICRVTLYKHLNAGNIKSVRVAGRRLVNVASLEAFATGEAG